MLEADTIYSVDVFEGDRITYAEFLEKKRPCGLAAGKQVARDAIHPMLFPFQRDLTTWAIRKGRCALFADTGLGKTFMQLEWARLLGERTLIVAPLSVARQTVREGEKINVQVHYTRNREDLRQINITNYEMVCHFDPTDFGAVVLDESSILKAIDGKTRKRLMDMFQETPYRLCCTATPAPNDIAEIANHSEFLGIMSRVDMLASFFVHDDEGWRLKGHAVEPFFRWLASWGMSIRMPSDLGYENDGFVLPPLSIKPHWVKANYAPEGHLFFTSLKGIQERHSVRRATLPERVADACELVNASNEQWLIWCGLNEEGRELAKGIEGGVLVEGADSLEKKIEAIEGFIDGRHRVMVTKAKIAGFGLNLQHCHNMAFVGLSDSWEAYYQCIRRCWRFGQESPVTVHIVLSDIEREIYANVMSKERRAAEMSKHLIENVQEFEKEEIGGETRNWTYQTTDETGDDYRLMLGDSAERLKEIEADTIGLSVYSPPFISLYTYSPTERDLGNSRTETDFFEHYRFIIDQLLRVTMPGRNTCVHVQQVPALLMTDGYIGLKDFRGKVIEAYIAAGWIYHGEVCIDKNPQAEAIRTHAKGLLFKQLKKDAAWLSPARADFILVFRKPGENPKPVIPGISNDDWIRWAHPVWYDIRQTDTLSVGMARGDRDERHICPLQLGLIERCIRLWSNKGDLVLDPFAGIGSTGHEAIRLDRRFVGVELKPEYFAVMSGNIRKATNERDQPRLFG